MSSPCTPNSKRKQADKEFDHSEYHTDSNDDKDFNIIMDPLKKIPEDPANCPWS